MKDLLKTLVMFQNRMNEDVGVLEDKLSQKGFQRGGLVKK